MNTRLPLTPMQHGMLYHAMSDQTGGVFVMQVVCDLQEELDTDCLFAAWEMVVAWHESLRTSIQWEGLGAPEQTIHGEVAVPVEQHDLRELHPEEREARLQEFLAADRARGFDLSTPPLMRLTLLRFRDAEYRLVWTYHHIVADGRARVEILKEVFDSYESLRRGVEPIRGEPVSQFRDYVAWVESQDFSTDRAFWEQTLSGFSGPTRLPVALASGDASSRDGYGAKETRLTEETTQTLRSVAKDSGVTLNTMLHGAWALLLSRYAGANDVVFGEVRTCRSAPVDGIDTMVGNIINTLPIRVKVTPDSELLPWLKEVRAGNVALRGHDQTPLLNVQAWSQASPGQPLFETIVTYDHQSLNAVLRQQGGAWEHRDFRVVQQPNYPLSVYGFGESMLLLQIVFDRRVYDDDTVGRVLGHLKRILEAMAAAPHQRLGEIPMTTAEERRLQRMDGNDTQRDYPSDLCLHQVVDAQAERTPDAIAVVFENESMTYRELNARANQLAHHLRTLSVGPGSLVGICMERSLDLPVGILGILKAGGAYVPMDPDYPSERLAFMLKDAQAPVLLTQRKLLEKLPKHDASVVCVDSDWESIATGSEQAPRNAVTPDDAAYVIYTSGSTGIPKGVVVNHHNVVRLFKATEDWFHFDDRDVWTLFHSVAFDFSVWEMWGALLHGGQLVVVSHAVSRSPEAFHDLLRDQGVTVLNQTPSAFRHLMETDARSSREETLALRYVIFGGEALDIGSLKPWFDRHSEESPRLVNMYGITETTVHVTYRMITAEDAATVSGSLIGVPIPDLQLYILDQNRERVPIGVPGEIFVGGAGVAVGYLNRPELTAERFIPNSFSSRPEARLYRTGDLARYLPNGDIEYLGRIDRQVKIRGYRIELGEIEAAIRTHPDVSDAIVIVREDTPNDKRLVAHIVFREGDPIPVTELRQFLGTTLPDHMIPSAYVAHDRLPLGPNGKVDRRSLAAGDSSPLPLDSLSREPETLLEEQLAGIWGQVLGVEGIGVYDNFFELGGHSLLATQVISRINATLHSDLPIRALFEAPTIVQLAEEVGRRLAEPLPSKARQPAIIKRPPTELRPLSFAQQRMWFLQRLEPDSTAFNVPSAFRVSGKLDVAMLERCLNEVVRRHEILRTTFVSVGGEPFQVVAPEFQLELSVINLTHHPRVEAEQEATDLIAKEILRRFVLDSGPLLTATLFKVARDEHILLLNKHHMISDWWGTGVLLRELAALYAAFSAGQPSPLPEPVIQYSDFAWWQREWLQGDTLVPLMAYWKERLAGRPPALELPTDRPRPTRPSHRNSSHAIEIPAALFGELKRLGQTEGVTPFVTVMAALTVLLNRYTGQDDIVVGAAIANRNRVETEGLIGLFLNSLALRIDVSGDPGFQEVMRRVHEVSLSAYTHQDLPFERLVEELAPTRTPGRNPIFQVMLVYKPGAMDRAEFGGLTVTPMHTTGGRTNLDITLYLSERGDSLQGHFEYDADLFDAATISRMAEHLQTLLESACLDPQRPISKLPLLSEAERRLMLVDWNETQQDHSQNVSVLQQVEAQVARTPDAVALEFEGSSLTYKELNARANQLGHHLRGLGVAPDVLVGISLERSPDLVISLLGVLKAGGAYLPLDPDYPRDRLAFILEDSGAALLVTRQACLARLPETGAQIVALDSDSDAIDRESQSNLVWHQDPQDLAYVIYTSGSTGKPKGVQIPHSALANLVQSVTSDLGIRQLDTLLAVTTLSFDIAALELFLPLSIGARVVLASAEVASDSRGLIKALAETGTTVMQATPATWRMLLDAGWRGKPDLKVLCGGEVLSQDLATELLPRCASLWNMYGPTETTIWSSVHHVRSADASIPIGRPIANTQLYILDPTLQPVPIGVPGELHIGGAGLARGYLNRPELTEERFVRNPFSEEPGARLYKSGDLARYLPDGNIEYLGRMDHQVKIRGYRIELGEIEAAIRTHPDVSDAIVIVREDTPNDKRLVAYVVPANGALSKASELQDHLKRTLPDYMIPSAFVAMETFPLTPNGKVDRKRLPAAELVHLPLDTGFVPPADPLEAQLAQLWAEVLGVQAVGATENFFGLGGHSLLVVRLLARIEKDLGKELPVATIFRAQTVREMAPLLRDEGVHPPASLLLPIQPQGSRPPFFCVHGAGGHALGFYDLAQALGPDQPFYGLQAIGRNGQGEPFTSIEAMAERYVEEVRGARPRGPYVLGGLCLGGAVALEMARRLIAEGEEVALVLLLDSAYPPAMHPRNKSLRSKEVAWHSTGRVVQYVLQLFRLGFKQQLNHLAAGFQIAGRLAWGKTDHMRLVHERANRFHVPRPYSGRLAVAMARQTRKRFFRDPRLAWTSVAPQVETFWVPGNLNTMLKQPHVAVLASAIRDRIDATWQGATDATGAVSPSPTR